MHRLNKVALQNKGSLSRHSNKTRLQCKQLLSCCLNKVELQTKRLSRRRSTVSRTGGIQYNQTNLATQELNRSLDSLDSSKLALMGVN